jgi:predicted RNA-binding Zn-ribbon protein involved in translation (DUF1610 family)
LARNNNDQNSSSPALVWDEFPKDEETQVALGEDHWGYVKDSRRGLEYRIQEALHFLSGDQWVRYLPHAQRFEGHMLDDWVPTPVTNYLVKHYDRIVDIFTSGDLLPIVDPATKDQADLEAAQASTRILQSEHRRLKTETELVIPAAGWLLVSGNVFKYAGWDGKSGERIRVPVTEIEENNVEQDAIYCRSCGQTTPTYLQQQPACPSCGSSDIQTTQVSALDSAGQTLVEKRQVQKKGKDGKPVVKRLYRGQIVEDVVNTLNFYPAPSKSFDRCRFAIEVDPMSVDAIEQIWGVEVTPENLEINDWGAVHNTHLKANSGFQKDEGAGDHALVKFLRVVPDPNRKGFEKGKLLIWANDKVLADLPLDSCDSKLPYTHCKYRDIPGMFWGASPFTDLITAQKRLNAVDSHIVQNRKQMVSNQWMIPEGAGVSHVDGRPGLIIRWSPQTTGGFKPERLQGVPVPQQVLEERQQATTDMEELSGAREVLQGDVPPGPETGAAIEFLQEQAFRRFGPAVQRWRAALADHERRKLLLVRKYWKEKRIVRVLGDNMETEHFNYSKADIVGAEDMHIRVGIGLQFSQTSKNEKLMKAAGQGLLGDIRDPNIRGRLLEKLQIEGFEYAYINDAKKARRVLTALQHGEDPPPLLPVDNHAVQYEVLKEHMLTAEYENWPQDIQQAILQRAMQHKQIGQQEQQQVMQAAQATKGAGPEAAQAVAASGAMGGGVETQAPAGG